MATFYTLIQPATQIAMAPIFPIFVKEWHVTFSKCANLSGVTVLTLGYINFVWVPLAESFGRRLFMISSLILILGANIWHALATSYDSFLGSSVLEGIGGGPVETLYPMIISDVVFLNDRGKFVTLYLASLFTSLILSPVVSAAMAENVGWRKYYWLNVGLRGVLIVAAIFAMPETKWSREDSTSVSTLVSVIPASLTKSLQRWWPNLASPGGSNSASPRDSSQVKTSIQTLDRARRDPKELAIHPCPRLSDHLQGLLLPHRRLCGILLRLVSISLRLYQVGPGSAVLRASLQLHGSANRLHKFRLFCRYHCWACHGRTSV